MFQAIAKFVLFVAVVAVCELPLQTRGDLFVGDNLTSPVTGEVLSGVVREYSNSGVPINPSLISGLNFVRDITISDNTLYVLTQAGINEPYKVGVYTTSGQTINPSLITGLTSAEAIAVSGNNVFVGTDVNNGTVAQYTTAGALVNPSLITGVQPNFALLGDLAISGGNLFVSSFGAQSAVGQYSLSGAPINPMLIKPPGISTALAVSGSHIFVRNSNNEEERGVDTIGEYTTSGQLVNPMFITGLTSPYAIAISGNDFFVAEVGLGGGEGRVGKYNLLGEPINPALITGLNSPSIAVSGATSTVPDSLSTLWLALPVAGMFAAMRFRRPSEANRLGRATRLEQRFSPDGTGKHVCSDRSRCPWSVL